MSDIQRAIIRHSIEDVIHILEHEPVKGDLVPQITAVQVMNRVAIAHLSIERAFKFLITKAGGPLVEIHNLRSQYQELLLHDPVLCWQSAQVGQIRTREDYYYEELRGSSLRVLL